MPHSSTSPASIAAEFDRLARDAGPEWSFNQYYHRRMVAHVPRGGRVLDAGSGGGELVAALATTAGSVLAVDLSPGMIAMAAGRVGALPNVSVMVGDVLTADLPSASFDAIVSVAALHHMPIVEAFAVFDRLLRPGGRLVVVDLRRDESRAERAMSAAATVMAPLVRLAASGRLESRTSRRAWAVHAAHDRFYSLRELAAAAQALPGARVEALLFWRFMLVWRKPER